MNDQLHPQNQGTPDAGRHPETPAPLQGVMHGLHDAAAGSSETMDPAKKAAFRADLLAHAARAMPVTPVESPVKPPAPVTPKPASTPRRPWFMWMGSLAAVAAVLVVAFVAAPKFLNNPGAPVTTGVLSRLVIPEAHAGDAFSLFAESSDAAGMDASSGWIVKSTVDVTKEQLTQTLRIVPAIDVTVEKTDATTFKVTPKEALDAGKVYQITLATDVKKPDGTTQKREFKWAMQTKNDLRVISSIPGDKSGGVPINTGIEFKFTYPDLESIKPYFSISPDVRGRFETYGRTVVFIPEKPLKNGTRYEVRVKKGLKVNKSQLALQDDLVVRFETERDYTNYNTKARFQVSPYLAVGTNRDIFVNSWGYYDGKGTYANGSNTSTIDVTAYKLTPDESHAFLNDRSDIPGYAYIAQESPEVYQKYAKNEAFKLALEPVQPQRYGQYMLTLPPQKTPGIFLVKIQPKNGDETWFHLQVTDHATYFLGDKDTLQTWVVNASTNAPWPNASVSAGSLSAKTDASGIARLDMKRLNATSTDAVNGSKEFYVVDVGEGADIYQALFYKNQGINLWGSYDYRFGPQPMYDQATAQFQVDRPLYHNSDDVKFSGIVQDRDSHQGVNGLKAELVRGQWYWDYFGREKVYQSQEVTVNGKGFFEGSLAVKDLSSGYYTLRLTKDGKLVTSRSFEVRDFKKPPYFIDVTTEASSVYAGQAVKGHVTAKFYDGTPFVKAKLTLNVYESEYGDGYYQGQSAAQTLELVTDDGGNASFDLPSGDVACALDIKNSCNAQKIVTYLVKPTDGEEADIQGSAAVTVVATDLSLDVRARTSSTTAYVNLQTQRTFLDPEKEPEAWGSRAIHGQIFVSQWVKIEDGTYYDFYQKKSFPRYRYERRELPEKTMSFDVVTDSAGKATYTYQMEKDYQYGVFVEAMDDKGRKVRPYSWNYAIGYYDYNNWSNEFISNVDAWTYWEDTQPQLAIEGGKEAVAQDDQVSLRYQIGKTPLDTAKTPGVLFTVMSRGIKKTSLSTGPSYAFAFDRSVMPSATVHAITFKDGVFRTVSRSVWLDTSTRILDVEVKPDQEKYAPGSKAKIKVTVKDKKTGQPVADARVTLSVVDKAIEGVVQPGGFPAEDPVGQLNGYVPEGLLIDVGSHTDEPVSPYGYGGAEKGGGGGGDAAPMAARALASQAAGDVRKLFKDTAAFLTGTTSPAGDVTLDVTWPDNLTSWRAEAVAIGNDLKAGAQIAYVPVTKPAFVDVVVPPRLLTKDKPVIKLRAYGTFLQDKAPVSFTVDAPTLGIVNQTVNGQAFVASYVAIDKLVPGTHTVTLRVTTPAGTDALERQVTIVDSNYTKDEEVAVDAGVGVGLPDIGADETSVLFVSKAQGSFLPEVRALAEASWSPRVDAQVASRMMNKLLRELFKVEAPTEAGLLSDYQDGDGSVKLFPYGSGDAELTAEVAATAPEYFNRDSLVSAFYNMLENRGTSRETQISALSGLAALREPVLPPMQAMLTQTDLGWREQLTLARGLVAAGDQEDAGKILDALLAKKQVRGTVTWLQVSDKKADNYEASGDAAALAASLARPEAEPLAAYVKENWSDEAFPLLAKARYLSAVVPLRPVQDVSLSYTLDGKAEETISLKEWPTASKTFTAAEAKAFRVTKVNGPVTMNFVKRVAGRPESKPNLSITRSYELPDKRPLSDMREGDVVTVKLVAAWQPNAVDWCYSLRDHLPGAFEATLAPTYDAFEMFTWYPYNVDHGEVSFVVCKDKEPRTITYKARVVSRGTFTAEAPVMQHVDHPSEAVVGKDEEITVK